MNFIKYINIEKIEIIAGAIPLIGYYRLGFIELSEKL